MNKKIIVKDKMQTYEYCLTEKIGEKFNNEFKPELSPKELLALGIFGGKYMTDCTDEFPDDWFENAKFSPEKKNIDINYYKVDASQSLTIWKEKGWINSEDPRGWFQWYCRYYYGRRIVDEDIRQIKRWKGMKRHVSALKNNCKDMDQSCRRKQRQALLHWAYDSRKI